MRLRTLDASLWLPRPVAEVFEFFSDAGNLEVLTPAFLHFELRTPRPIAMCAGATIDYRIRLHGIPISWQTVITSWDPPVRFVDEQRHGPYRRWVHTHTFEPVDGGTRVRDHVEYAVRGGFLEPLLHRFLVAPDLRTIFDYRQRRIRELLAPESTTQAEPIALSLRGS